jgi:hypothetical protein
LFKSRKSRYIPRVKVKEKKTVRFARLVEECGQPEQVTLWTAPEENRDFTKAVKENRVVTVIHHNVGSKVDYGLVGFVKQPLASFLVFPKTLGYPAETKIIGIKYEQIAESKPKGPLFKSRAEKLPGIQMREKPRFETAEEAELAAAESSRRGRFKTVKRPVDEADRHEPQKGKSSKITAKPRPAPKLHRFRAEVKIVTTQVVPVEVEAATAKEAGGLVREKAQAIEPDPGLATVTRTPTKPKKVPGRL